MSVPNIFLIYAKKENKKKDKKPKLETFEKL